MQVPGSRLATFAFLSYRRDVSLPLDRGRPCTFNVHDVSAAVVARRLTAIDEAPVMSTTATMHQ
jgi:hypothetical protein